MGLRFCPRVVFDFLMHGVLWSGIALQRLIFHPSKGHWLKNFSLGLRFIRLNKTGLRPLTELIPQMYGL